MQIDAISPIRPPQAPMAPVAPGAAGRAGFSELFNQAVDQVSAAKASADSSIASFLNGETEDLHKVALAQQRASIQFDLFLQVRNKLVSAYQEVMRSQL